jgi:O-antigen ligase
MNLAADAPSERPAEAWPAPDRVSTWIGMVALAVCALTPILAYLGNLGFAVLVAVAGLLCLPLFLRSRRPSVAVALVTALAVWAAVSSLWSPLKLSPADLARHGVEQLTAVKLVMEAALYSAFVVAAGALSQRDSRRATLALGIGLAAVALVFLVDAVFKAPFYRFIRAAAHQQARPDLVFRDMSRVSYVLALLFWPMVVRFERPAARVAAAGLALATLIASYIVNADAPFATLAVSGAVFFAVRYLGRPALVVLLVGVVAYFIAAPLLIGAIDGRQPLHPAADDIRQQSWAIRLDIWRFAGERIREHPFFGWGLDAARTFSPNIPLHTHDAAMQIWLELGAVGAILACLFWCWIVRQIDRVEDYDRPLAAACAAAASAYLTIGALSFGVWQDWWLALGALTAAVCIALARTRADPGRPAGANLDDRRAHT